MNRGEIEVVATWMDGAYPTPSPLMVSYAEAAARESPCAKSKRGAVVLEVDKLSFTVYGSGYNGQPGFYCDGSDACRRDCGKICMHAETRAILRAVANRGTPRLEGLHLIHVKFDRGVAPGGPPSCWQCSKLILDVGIDSVWLYEDIGAGVGRWQRYTAKDFHLATLHNCKDGPLHGALP